MAVTLNPILKNSKVIFSVADVVATTTYFREILGFEKHWHWGEPATFGGASFGRVDVMFCQQAELAGKVEGHQHWFDVDDVNALHELHLRNGAAIVEPIGDKPWGAREYTVRDINGYHLRFAGSKTYVAPVDARKTLREGIRIVARKPTLEEYTALNKSVGWNDDPRSVPLALEHSHYCVVAVDGEQVVGMVRVVGDQAKFAYVQDMMVQREYQNQRIGTALMDAVMEHLHATLPEGAMVNLFTGPATSPFYERWGFKQGYGMLVMKTKGPFKRI